jgi:hypothetical protein
LPVQLERQAVAPQTYAPHAFAVSEHLPEPSQNDGWVSTPAAHVAPLHAVVTAG